MTGTPKDRRALYLTAAHCNHPELDGIDSALLMYLAANAHSTRGARCRPGNEAIASALKLKSTSAVNARLAKNIARGLIERTEIGNGYGKASAYRLCLENPAYPDYTPNQEPLTEELESQRKPRRIFNLADDTARRNGSST